MMAAEVGGGETRILAEGREVTRLGESVFRSGQISADALQFLLATLSRMAEEHTHAWMWRVFGL